MLGYIKSIFTKENALFDETQQEVITIDQQELINPFQSFYMGGYECTDQLNNTGNRVDLLELTGHIDCINDDYERLKPFNINTVREGIRWSKVETKPYRYDFSEVKKMLDAAKRQDIQQVWDICHFGFPDDLSPFHPQFARRFASLCRAFAEFYMEYNPVEPLIVTPINEVSFLSWLGGDVAGTSPYCRAQGWNVKYELMKAYILGVAALREVDPRIRILTTEPLVNIVPPLDATKEQILEALQHHENQYQALDMLSGKICPELGGRPEYLDILGFNYYYNNQWVSGFQEFLPWANESEDERWRPLAHLLQEAHLRYNRPVVLSETSHPGEDRPIWITHIAEQCLAAIELKVPLWGICLYPIIDRPDWDHLENWHHSGLWDADEYDRYNRILNIPYALALRKSQKIFLPWEQR